MSHERLREIASTLETRGVDARVLRDLESELAVIEAPPGILARMTGSMRKMAETHWGRMVGELRESREMVSLVKRRIGDDQPLTEEERAKVKAQLGDMLRAVPAGFIAATNSVLPFPGTSIMTPWLLSRMGLMPSRWREAHVLDQLRKQSQHLRQSGQHSAADQIDALQSQIEVESDARESAAQQAALLTHWDANNNGEWDEDERRAYRTELRRIQSLALSKTADQRWFLQFEGQVFGPVRLTQLVGDALDGSLLVCFDGKSGWVGLDEVLSDL